RNPRAVELRPRPYRRPHRPGVRRRRRARLPGQRVRHTRGRVGSGGLPTAGPRRARAADDLGGPPMTPDGRIVRAMVLSGGSAYAASEVGALKALTRGEPPATGSRPLEPDVYVGPSAGGVNAAVMSSHPGRDILAAIDFLERLWMDHLAADRPSCR